MARRLPRGLVLGVRPLLARALRARLGGDFRTAVAAALNRPPTPDEERRYFQGLADFHAYAALIARSNLREAAVEGLGHPDEAALSPIRAALAGGKGAVLAFPHLTGYEFGLGTLSENVPMSVLARTSPDPVYQVAKADWYASLGLEIAWRARRGAGAQSLGEVTRFLRVLKGNRVLAITPDLLFAPGTGVAVRLFGRKAELPAGPFFLAARTGAPLLPAFLYYAERRNHVRVLDPLPVPQGDRDTAVAGLAQDWAAGFEQWLSAHPETWQFWLDKRWAGWLATDPASGGGS